MVYIHVGHMQTVTSHSLFNTAVNCWQVTIEHGTHVLELRNLGYLPLQTTDHDMLMIMTSKYVQAPVSLHG